MKNVLKLLLMGIAYLGPIPLALLLLQLKRCLQDMTS